MSAANRHVVCKNTTTDEKKLKIKNKTKKSNNNKNTHILEGEYTAKIVKPIEKVQITYRNM
jgi:hypothetical protein